MLPDNVPPARAVLAANLETALNGVWDAAPHIGDRIAVIGAGTVGCLAAWLVSRVDSREWQIAGEMARRDDWQEEPAVVFPGEIPEWPERREAGAAQ